MSDGMRTGLGTGSAPSAHARVEDEKTTLDQAERWATLLGAQLASTHALPLPSEAASAWHPGAGDLTPSSSNDLTGASTATGPGSGPTEASDTSENRMIVRVDGGDLGEVALVVDRRAGAIRVTISAADAGAEAALGLERAGLLQALQSHGITVESVTVVRANHFGTVLALPKSNATQRTRETREAESTDDEHARRRLARKLNLIG